MDLARFAWEVWAISADVAATGTIRIIRSPTVIRNMTGHARYRAILDQCTGCRDILSNPDRRIIAPIVHRSVIQTHPVVFVGLVVNQLRYKIDRIK